MLLDEVGVSVGVLADNGLADLIEESALDAEQSAVAGGSPEQAAQDESPALV